MVAEIIKKNLFTYFNLVFFVLAVLLAIVEAWQDMLFVPVILANTLIGIIQEVHSQIILDKLSILNEKMTKVFRNDKLIELRPEELALEDIIFLEAGNQIPADAVVLSGTGCVNEALITGEADEIIKLPGDELLSGSFVVSGSIKAKLTRVGTDSYASKLVESVSKNKKGEQSEMIKALNYMIVIAGIIIIPIGVVLFTQAFFYNGNTFHDSITGMVAAVVGMIPEGLYLLASVAMALSTIRLGKKKVLVHDMKCIETLARVDVLCVDKTGTITEEGMHIYDVKRYNTEADTLLAAFSKCMPSDNETIKAFKNYFKDYSECEVGDVFTFSSKYKYSGAVIDNRSYVLGAPEYLLKDGIHDYVNEINEHNKKGYRVLAFGEYKGKLNGKELVCEVVPLAFVIVANPIRTNANKIFEYFLANNVEIKVISGDNPISVSTISKKAGVAYSDNYIDASVLNSTEDYYSAVEKYTVFGRVSPEQKSELIKALKKHNKTVAMVGDGVNDILALKEADCSIAMASGSDIASKVSQLVLLDSDFARMPDIIMEGRRVVNNIQRTASLYIVKNIFSMLLAIFFVALMLDYPLKPSQISLISTFTIGIPSFFLALEANKAPIEGNFLINVMRKALPGGITAFLVISGLVIYFREFGIEEQYLSTSCTILVAIVGFSILYKIAKPMKKGHIIMLIGLIIGMCLSIILVGELFEMTIISPKCIMLVVLFALLIEPLIRYLEKAVS